MKHTPKFPLTSGETAKLFGVHRKTILDWIRKGHIKPIKSTGEHRGARYLIDAKHVAKSKIYKQYCENKNINPINL